MVQQRNTWQRDRVREALADAAGFVSAQTLHATLRGETGIGLATVYRALAGLAASGEADSLLSPEGEAMYRACSTRGHHHHLICRSCGSTVEISGHDVEQWAHRTAALHGYTEAEHIVDIFGVCAACTARYAAEGMTHPRPTRRPPGGRCEPPADAPPADGPDAHDGHPHGPTEGSAPE